MYLTLLGRNHHLYNKKKLFQFKNIIISVLFIFILYKNYIINFVISIREINYKKILYLVKLLYI